MEGLMSLSRLVYFSENKIESAGRGAQMAELQRVAVSRNRRRGITGALVYDERFFAQALEGELRVVQEVFDLIARDTRHANVTVTSTTAVPEHLFGNWSMGFAARTRETETLFGLHWCNTSMNPRIMSEQNILKLMVELGRQGFMGLGQHAA
jgi:Sensors of blue-light using FAD